MSTERATFSLELRDGISAPAASAVDELQRLRDGMSAGMARLRDLNEAMRRLRDGGDKTSETFKQLKLAADNQKVANRLMQEAYLRLGGTFGEVARSAQPAQSALGRLAAMAGGIAGLTAAITGLVFGALAVSRAAMQATIDLTRYAIVSADARRVEMLRLEGLVSLRQYQRAAAGSAQELISAIDRVSAASAMGRADVTSFGEQLYRAGLRGAELEAALDGVTTASVQGDRAALRYPGLARAIHRTGGSVRNLSEDVRRRLGGIAQRQALALDVQARHLRESFAHLFDGLRLDGFLRALREVTGLFDQNNAVGRAFAAILRSIFQPLLDGVGRAGPVMRTFFEGLTIMALRIGIGVLIARNAILRAFGEDTVSQVDSMRVALVLGGVAAIGLATVLASAAISAAALAATLSVVAAPALLAARAIATITEAAEISGGWAGLGRALVDGFVGGITSRIEAARTAVRGLAASATEALRGALDIRSPSRVFAALGAQIPAGLAEGVREGSSLAADAVDAVVDVPRARGAAGGGPTIGELHVHVDGGGGGARDIAEGIRDELVRLLAGIGSEIGAPA
jgi:hypothetical protein